ncbi:MAG: hypothetical protein QHJ73_18755 [Armatimonadota bacterium]|nr:hypothetical protein [Armatimonadota bacterium]
MLRHVWCAAVVLGLLATAGAGWAEPHRRADVEEWVSRVRLMASAGVNSTAVINFLTFREGEGNAGWNWQLLGAYPLERPFFFEAGLMGWTLGRTGRENAERFAVAASLGVQLNEGRNELGAGLVPSGFRVFLRHFLDPRQPGRGTLGQVGLVFPTTTGTRTFLDLSLGYVF